MTRSNEIVEFEGWEELNRNLDLLADLPAEDRLAAIGAGGKPILDEANRAAPGPYIIMVVELDRSGNAVAKIGPDEEHWYYQFFETGATAHEIQGKPLLIFEGELGKVITHQVEQAGGLAAKPFLRPSLDAMKEAAVQAVLQVILETVRRMVTP